MSTKAPRKSAAAPETEAPPAPNPPDYARPMHEHRVRDELFVACFSSLFALEAVRMGKSVFDGNRHITVEDMAQLAGRAADIAAKHHATTNHASEE